MSNTTTISFFGTSEQIFPKNKRKKGKSLIAFPDSYTVIDIETTGLSPEFDSIIEVSALKYENNILIDSYTSLLRPDDFAYYDDENTEFGYYVNDYITKLTGITNEMLIKAPDSKTVLTEFYNFIGDSVLIGHNINFDINFLYDKKLEYFDQILENDFVDTLRLSRFLLKELSHHRLHDLISHFNIKIDVEHRAEADCLSTNEVYHNLKSCAINQYENIDAFTSSHKRHDTRAKDITATADNLDEGNPLFGRVCVFTGTLEKMHRKEAMQIVVNIGGIVADNVTKKTNYLILGNNDYCASTKNKKSNKQKKAETLKLSGQDIDIISENVFYDMISY